MKNLLLVSFLFIISILFIGCSGGTELGNEEIVEYSGDKPTWLTTPTRVEGDNIYITGEITRGKDRSFGFNQAFADGFRKLLNMMENDVQALTVDANIGANKDESDMGKYSAFIIAWINKTSRIAGVQNPESYWEKIKVQKYDGVTYFYNCYTLLKISKQDYNKALQNAFEVMQKKAIEENNKAAEELSKIIVEKLSNLK